MEDREIVSLFWQRDEAAIAEAERKYGTYCLAIAGNILQDAEDARECVNDALLGAWNAMPPHRPERLSAFLGKITRRQALKRRRDRTAQKRGGGAWEASVEELAACLPAGRRMDEGLETEALTAVLDGFLADLPPAERRVFLRRYWYCDPVRAIASRYGFSESKVKMMLKRTRDKLRARLGEEEIWI